MVILFIDPAADSQHEQSLHCHQQMILQRRNSRLDHDQTEIPDKKIHRICKKKALDLWAEGVNRIENCRQIHQQLSKHTPQILDVTEEDKQSRQDHSHADVEQYQQTDRVKQADEAPGERDMVQDAEDEEHAERQAEVNQALDIFGKQENILWHVDLGEDVRIAHQRCHALIGRIVEEREDQVAAEEVRRIVRRVASEEIRENQAHDQEGQQRRQNTPSHPQYRSLVFRFEVAFDQFLKEELICF